MEILKWIWWIISPGLFFYWLVELLKLSDGKTDWLFHYIKILSIWWLGIVIFIRFIFSVIFISKWLRHSEIAIYKDILEDKDKQITQRDEQIKNFQWAYGSLLTDTQKTYNSSNYTPNIPNQTTTWIEEEYVPVTNK